MWWIALKQVGEGCDYRIGCGMQFYTLKAQTVEAATKEALEIIRKQGTDQYAIEKAMVFYDPIEMDCQGIRRQIKAERAAADEAVREVREKAEFERLQKKFGGQS